MAFRDKKCVLCGKNYKPRTKYSWFCLDCYLNDFIPNRHKYSIEDFSSGIYSFTTGRHIDNFYKPSKYSDLSVNDAYKQIALDLQTENTDCASGLEERSSDNKCVSPEHGHKKIVDALLSKTTYV